MTSIGRSGPDRDQPILDLEDGRQRVARTRNSDRPHRPHTLTSDRQCRQAFDMNAFPCKPADLDKPGVMLRKHP
ncbi:hypothetical protein [Candidatus Magnetaquiglobus chichijimensis]|uniref:hypothetical protein n=1 Tax=Candidatus Magnetaquiglobus chichijimensis TaxID=3141448 RepID=UPI003B96D8DF